MHTYYVGGGTAARSPKRYLGGVRRVRFVEHGPQLGLEPLPPGESTLKKRLLETEFPSHLLVAGLLRVQVQPVQNRERLLRVPVL